jgi:hypothetical protein
LTVPKPPDNDVRTFIGEGKDHALTNKQDDPLVEYEDEFGRVRTVRRSEVPREVLERKRQEEEAEEDECAGLLLSVGHQLISFSAVLLLFVRFEQKKPLHEAILTENQS